MRNDLLDALRYSKVVYMKPLRHSKTKILKEIRANMKEEKIEVGDTVQVSKLVYGGFQHSQKDVKYLGKTGKVTEVIGDCIFVKIGEEKVGLPDYDLTLSKKAPKTLYFDARKIPTPKTVWDTLVIRNHGKSKEYCNWLIKEHFKEGFTTGKPAPLQIIDGEVK